jgi:GT2 family glycosyltransferase/glycosyltransferase involved in cell wall biosynthesis
MQQQSPSPKFHHRHQALPTLSITIIVRTKDRPHLLTRCLQSLAEQERLPDEIIVVNDGGCIVKQIISEFTELNIQLLENANSQGRAHAGNQGVLAATREFIGFLDDDDRLLPDHLQRLEQALLNFDAKVAYSGCQLLQRDMLGEPEILREQPIGQFNDPFDAQRLQYENYIPLINLLIQRELWLQVGGFDETFDLFEDWDVLLRLAAHTPFYHLNRVTTEYAVWGHQQITQDSNQQRWREAYQRILAKHWLPLPTASQLHYLAEYWRVSQERRSIIQEAQREKQALQAQLAQAVESAAQTQHQHQAQHLQAQQQYQQLQAEWIAKYEPLSSDHAHLQTELNQSQADWLAKYQQLQTDWLAKYQQSQADWLIKYQQLQADYNRLQADWLAKYQLLQADNAQQLAASQAQWTKQYEELQKTSAKRHEQLQLAYNQQEIHFQQQQADMLKALTDEQQRYHQLQTATQSDAQQYQSLQQALHELSKQIAVGITQATVEKIFSLQSVKTVSATGNTADDYYRLVEWIRDKAVQLDYLQNQFITEMQPLRLEAEHLRNHFRQVMQSLATFQPPYYDTHLLTEIDHRLESFSTHTENLLASYCDIDSRLNLKVVNKHLSPDEVPPARNLSNIYPTFISFAGSAENLQWMEQVAELGTLPFMLETGKALVFTVYCALNNFCRLDVLLATCLRINTCQVRTIIRELESKTPVRTVMVEGIEIFDNRLHAFHFEPITDSAGKIYQIELDSPDATGTSCIAAWCHTKLPTSRYSEPRLPETTQRAPHTLPQWVQHSLLDTPLAIALNTPAAENLFIVNGIKETNSVLQVHLWLRRLSLALQQAKSSGNVILTGKPSRELQQYCQRQPINVNVVSTPLTFATTLRWAQTQQTHKAKYLWYCQLDALPQLDMIERAQEMFATNASLLIPLEKHSNGTIRAGYASLVRDGLLRTSSAGAPADHPYYGYQRTLDAASSQLIVITSSELTKLAIHEIEPYHTPIYQLTELIWQLKNQGYQSLYQAALNYENDQPYPEFTETDYNDDNQRFYRRWQTQLPTYTAPLTRQLEQLLNPQQQPTVLIIDATLPMYDQDSGSLRLYTLLKIWATLGYRITFFPDNLDSQFKYRHALESLGIEVFHSQYGIADALAYRQFDFAWICRVTIGHRYLPIIRLLSPTTVIFYDTVDIHYIREQRQAEIENNPQLATHAKETKRQELANCLLANCVITVTADDAHHLQQELPQLTYAVIPNIHQPQPLTSTTFAQRDGLVFIGNYNHQPNEDSVYYFVEHIFPKIREKIPEICFHIIGSHLKEKMKTLANAQIKVIGWVEQVAPEFAQRRIFVSYLRYGAGMKGKLGQALALGLPVVTTTIGAEGMGLVAKETALIADDAESFAQAVCQLYTDATLWEKLARQGKEYIEQQYGETAVREQLQHLLANWV